MGTRSKGKIKTVITTQYTKKDKDGNQDIVRKIANVRTKGAYGRRG